MALLRLLVLWFLILTVVYVAISVWSRLGRRRELARIWEEEGRVGDFGAYMRDGMAEYDRSLRRKLIWLVYVIPMAVVATLIYVMNVT